MPNVDIVSTIALYIDSDIVSINICHIPLTLSYNLCKTNEGGITRKYHRGDIIEGILQRKYHRGNIAEGISQRKYHRGDITEGILQREGNSVRIQLR